MIAIKHIFCPTDLSDESDAALSYAISLARTYESKLSIYHCGAASTPVGETAREKFEEWNEASIRKWTGFSNGLPADYESMLVRGDPVETINKAAAGWRADLIVMRSRHHRPQAAALLGSTAEAVCRTAPCPVLITHPNKHEWVGMSRCEIDLRKILVACDFSTDSELALQLALSFAQEYQAELHLLHVLPVTLSLVVPHETKMRKKDFLHIARLLRQAVPDKLYLWCKVAYAVKNGQPYREILSYAEENEIDLICMGVHGTGIAGPALFGSNTDRVLRQAPCPVLIARPLKPMTFENGKNS